MTSAQADRALADGRWDEARRLYEGVLARDPHDARALAGLGTALYWLEEHDASFDLRGRAYRLFIEQDDPRSAARVAMEISLDVADIQGMPVSSGWLQRAARLLADIDRSPEHGWLALWEGHFARALEHDLDKAREHAAQAREIGREFRLSDLELMAVALEGLIDVTAGRVREGMRQLDEAAAAAIAGEISDIGAVIATSCFLVHACERVYDWQRASQWSVQLDSLARRWQLGTVFATCQAEHAALLVGCGEWERAERNLVSSMETLRASRPLLVHEAIVQFAELRRRQGRTDEARKLFNECAKTTESILGLAEIALERGDATRAAEALDRLLRRPLAEKWVERARAREILVRARLARGEQDLAEAAAGELSTIARSVDLDIVSALSALASAYLATHAGDHAEARHRLEDAIDLFERCPAPWEAARTRLLLAASLRQLGRDSFAREELVAARVAFERLGAKPWADHAAALLGEVVPAGKPPLTRRELEVLGLVARGMSDKEVAAALELSQHTIHRHVSNILMKLQTPTRAAAVATASAARWIDMADSGHS
jgi:ATP/maltotriose-dependent transcriptional regulator MalT